MKRTIIVILICGIMVLGIAGCGSSKNDVNSGDKSNVVGVKNNIKNNITLSLKEGTLKNTGATFILKNNSDIVVLYGNPYWIEKETDGIWSKVKTIEDMNFTLPEFGLLPKETKEFKINFEYGYGKLSYGKYRLVKDITVEYEDDTRESFDVTAEFSIEDK